MIRTLELENFKGFAARQRVDFAPLTLLFGANSAGKSTLLQALLYLHELLERGTADVDRTELGGTVLELGGFARLVHRHETNRAIVLRVEFATPGALERFGRDLTDFPFPDLDDDVESAWLEVTVRFHTTAAFRGPLVDTAVLGVGGEAEPLVWLETRPFLQEGEPIYARVNLGHPLIAKEARDIAEAWDEIAVPEDVLRREPADDLDGDGGGSGSARGRGDGSGYGGGDAYGAGTVDGFGFGDGRPRPIFAVSRTRLSALPPGHEPLRVIPVGDDSPEKTAAAVQVRTFLEMVVLGTTAQLVSALRDALYIGPLRTVPPRGFLYERAGRITSWADGLAAWDLLLADRGDLVDRTNHWLRRLEANCQIVVQQLFHRAADAEDISGGHVDKTVRRLLLDTGNGSLVLPSEVGAGIAQLIPVIVASLDSRGALSLMEQPEIHVHPALQVGLGDLFIEAASRDGARRTQIIETHSEHLILRILRRIRETTANEPSKSGPTFAEDKLSVLHVESLSDGVRVRQLRVDEAGEFKDPWPKGFFDERFAEIYGS